LYCGSEPRGLVRGSSPADRCGARSRVVWYVGARRRIVGGSGAAWFGTWELAGGSLAGELAGGSLAGPEPCLALSWAATGAHPSRRHDSGFRERQFPSASPVSAVLIRN
jgi:hypothetical protein